MTKFTEKTKINTILKEKPEAIVVMMKYGLTCVGCPFAMQETLEQGAKAHGIDVKKLLDEINNL